MLVLISSGNARDAGYHYRTLVAMAGSIDISEACIGWGTKYPISLEVNRQISIINRQISP